MKISSWESGNKPNKYVRYLRVSPSLYELIQIIVINEAFNVTYQKKRFIDKAIESFTSIIISNCMFLRGVFDNDACPSSWVTMETAIMFLSLTKQMMIHIIAEFVLWSWELCIYGNCASDIDILANDSKVCCFINASFILTNALVFLFLFSRLISDLYTIIVVSRDSHCYCVENFVVK